MPFPCEVTNRIGTTGTMGPIVLQVVDTIEQGFRRLFSDLGIARLVRRVASAAGLIPDTAARMALAWRMARVDGAFLAASAAGRLFTLKGIA